MARRIIALEYAIEGCIDGGAYLVTCASVGEILDAIDDCVGLTEHYPPGVTEEAWDKHGPQWYNEFSDEAVEAAHLLWHFKDADVCIPLPWRDGFVVRAWRVSPTEAKEWKE